MSKRFSVFFKTKNATSESDAIRNIQVDIVNENPDVKIYHRNRFSPNSSDSNNIIAIQDIKSQDGVKLLDKKQRKITANFYYFHQWNKKYHLDIYMKKYSNKNAHLSIRGSCYFDYEIDGDIYDGAVLEVDGIKSKIQFSDDSTLIYNITDIFEKDYNISSIKGDIKSEPSSVITIEDNEKFSNINLNKIK